jgi:hypothetical protein
MLRVEQERVQEAVGALADLEEQIADAHAALQAQHAQQLAVQAALLCASGPPQPWPSLCLLPRSAAAP